MTMVIDPADIDDEPVETIRYPDPLASFFRLLDPMPWREFAVCSGMNDLFFAPEAERPEPRQDRERRARSVCSACQVVIECRTFAREHAEVGFWGGESEYDRAALGISSVGVPSAAKRTALAVRRAS